VNTDVSLVIHFPLLDRLFGTYHLPEGEWLGGCGIGDHPVLLGYLKQFNGLQREKAGT
jgi:sterol desaturase/sphingolipid hydroxylase (fatty acid hydroxylase superfamily)